MLSCSAALALGCVDTKDPSDAGASDARAPAERVLFVGNSYTYYHDMPDMVRSIAEASGLRLDVEMIAPGGATLRDHWNSSGARERVEEGFDAVVIQAQSTETLSPAFDDAARLFADAIQEAGSRGVWYSHWGRRDLETHADQIEAAYSRAAATHGHAVARVGEAFLIAERRHPEVALLGPDGSHPSPEGSLLAACVLFQSITGVSPRVPSGITGLPDLVAQSICSIADDGVPCDSVQSICGGECVSWSVDACGGCDVRCDEGDPCLAGVCGCGDGPLTGCDGACVDLRSSRLHCGACGVECALLETCVEGSCSCPEGLVQSTYLSFAEPIECVSFLLAMEREETLECKESIHEACRAIGGERECFASGFGPATGSSGIGNQYVRCVQAEVSTTSYSELALWAPECEPGTLSQACTSAIHRWCVSRGARTGFGPVSVAGDAIEVSCLRDATLVRATHAEVSESHCAADPVRCSVAAWDTCVARGHSSGFGPVEVFGDEVEIACVD